MLSSPEGSPMGGTPDGAIGGTDLYRMHFVSGVKKQ